MDRLPIGRWARIVPAACFLFAASLVGSQLGQGRLRPPVSPGRYALTLEKAFAGFAMGLEGGGAKGRVTDVRLGNSLKTKKALSSVSFTDLQVVVPVAVEQPLFDWLVQSWSGQATRRNGVAFTLDSGNNATSQLEFTSALLSETVIPELNAASKQVGALSLTVTPESTRRRPASGKVAGAMGVQKPWIASNFRLSIAGLDCSRVHRIEAFAVKQHTTTARMGDNRMRVAPLKLEVPNLVFYLPEAFAKPFFDWHEDFVVKGNNGDVKERSGTLELLDASLKQSLLTIGFSHLGVLSVDPMPPDGSGALRNVRVEMYCEEMTLSR